MGYNSFGRVRYTLHAYAGEPESVTIGHGENNWVGKALNTLQQEQDLKISGKGHVARKLFGRIMRMAGTISATGPDPFGSRFMRTGTATRIARLVWL